MLEIKEMKIGFIGYGNMAGATARGLMKSGAVSGSHIFVCAKDYQRLCEKAGADGVNPCRSAEDVVKECQLVFVGVKPHLMEPVMGPLKDLLEGKIVISLATKTYGDALDRIMPKSHNLATAPNTPVSICEGIFICEEDNSLTDEERVLVEKLLKNLGLFLWMDREHMAIAGVVAGCTPAFVAMLIEALGDAGCRHGMTREVAYSIIGQMLAGTGKMALETRAHPGEMKDAVCSPGGSTIVGVAALEKNGFRHALIDAIDQIAKVL